MALMLIKQILNSQDNQQVIDSNLVVDATSGKAIAVQFQEIVNLLKDGTTDASGGLPEDSNTLLKISTSLQALKTTVNDFLTGEDNEGDIDRLSELVKAIQNNRESIDALLLDNLTKADLVNGLTSDAADKALTAAQGKALKDLIDALETGVNTMLGSNHSHANQEILAKIGENADGDLEFNGKVLNGATSVAMISDSDETPVFNEKLILVVTPLTPGE